MIPRQRADARRNQEALLDAATAVFVTSGVPAPWWEILVPEEQLAEGTLIIERERADIEANAGEAAAAAEAEFDTPQT